MANNGLSHPTRIESFPMRLHVRISRVFMSRMFLGTHTYCDCGIVMQQAKCLETAVEHLMEAQKGRTIPLVLPISCGRWAVAT